MAKANYLPAMMVHKLRHFRANMGSVSSAPQFHRFFQYFSGCVRRVNQCLRSRSKQIIPLPIPSP
jgi:hypothetical protein